VDEITVQAIDTMAGVLQSFLPPAVPNVSQNLVIIPKKVRPTGLGGYVGVNETPAASLLGRHIVAITEVSLTSSNGVAALQQSTGNVTRELLSQDRATLRAHGIFKIELDELSAVSHSGTGNNATDFRIIRFHLDFECIPIPAAPQGIIDTLDYDLDLGLAYGKAEFLNLDFAILQQGGTNPLLQFDFVDDPDLNVASPHAEWSFDAASGAIRQTQDVHGGPATLAQARKAGAQALVRDGGQPYLARNLIIKADLRSTDTDGIGFVFRWQDANNYYFYLMSDRHDYHLIGKKVAGNFDFLQQGGRNETIGYTSGQIVGAQLLVEDRKFQVNMNGHYILTGMDTDIAQAGRIGFLTHRNNDAQFFNLNLTRFSM
jgi:hypothetical protein